MNLMRSVLFVLLSVLALSGLAQTSKSKAAERLDQFIMAFNSKDRAKIASMVDSLLAKGMLERRKREDWIEQTVMIAEDLAPITVQETLLDKGNRVVVAIKNKGGARLGLAITVEDKEPFGIAGIQIEAEPENLIGPPKKPYYEYTSLQDLAEKIRTDSKAPALAISVWRDGKFETLVSGVRKLGVSDAAMIGDRWLIGSITKSMTATLIGTMIQEGKLSWDSKLGDLLKDIPMNDAYKGVTIEQILRHRSGLPQDMNFTGSMVQRIAGALKDPEKVRASYAKDILGRQPIAKPDAKFAYSNAGYALLGHIAERILGKPYEQLMSERVFGPIGMKSAICGMPGAEGMPSGKGQPSGHFLLKEGPRPGKLGGAITYMCAPAGGGVAMSIEDLARYAAWHMRGFNGENVGALKTEIIRRLHTPPSGHPGQEPYAAGWMIEGKDPKTTEHTHNGSDGTFTAEMSFWPEAKLVVVAIVNMGGEAEPSPGRQAVNSVYRKLIGG